MTRVGLVGGIGLLESTIDYYRPRSPPATSIVMDSLDVARLIGWMTRNELPGRRRLSGCRASASGGC